VSDDHKPSVGPVMAFTAKRADVVRFYTEIAGLSAELEGNATWLAAENAQLVVHDPDDRQTEPDVRGQRGFVVWFGVDDVASAFGRAKAAGCAIGEFQGDYFYARDPDGRYVGFHGNDEHGHGGHEHGGDGHDH
jgi:predicted enzyme related to lactoylglutathione lyase